MEECPAFMKSKILKMICHQKFYLPMVFHLAITFGITEARLHYNELSPELVNTLLISEDHRFYQHSGLDLPAYLSRDQRPTHF